MPSEWEYPYISGTGKAGQCHGTSPFPPEHPHSGAVMNAANVTGHVVIPSNNYGAMMAAIATVGPLAISVDAGAWHDYAGGVFNGGNHTNPTLDHLVQLVGYGTDPKHGDYWLVRHPIAEHVRIGTPLLYSQLLAWLILIRPALCSAKFLDRYATRGRLCGAKKGSSASRARRTPRAGWTSTRWTATGARAGRPKSRCAARAACCTTRCTRRSTKKCQARQWKRARCQEKRFLFGTRTHTESSLREHTHRVFQFQPFSAPTTNSTA